MGKIVKNVIFTILFLALITATALLSYLYFFASGDRNLSGQWTAKLDVSERAAVAALGWLQDIEGVSVSLEDIEVYMEDLAIEVRLDLQQTARSEGSFQCYVLPESYDACIQSAYEAFARAFRELLTERLRMAGYTGDTGEEAIEALVIETFGMPTVSYLLFSSPDILPSLEELQAQYDGGGTYEAAGGVLTRQFDAGQAVSTKTEYYIQKDSTLILSDAAGSDHSTIVYTLQQLQNQ